MPKKKGNLRGALVAHGRQQEQKLKQEAVLEAQKRKVESMKKSGGSGGKNEISKRRKTNDGKAGEQTSSAGTKDVAQSASKVQKPSRTRKERVFMPFQQDDSILLVGEGNFSFALSLLQPPHSLSPRQILATAYDSEQECYRKYPDAEAIVAKIRDLAKQSGREEEIVVFGVDAGNLSASKAVVGNPSKAAVVGYHRKGPQTRKFSKIWFGFPHVGAGHKDESRNILANQLLLVRFLVSAAPLLSSGPLPAWVQRNQKGKRRRDDDSEEEDGPEGEGEQDEDVNSDGEGDLTKQISLSQGIRPTLVTPRRAGSVLITLRNSSPYTLWDVPTLAKRTQAMLPIIQGSAPALPKGQRAPSASDLTKAFPDPKKSYVIWQSARFEPAVFPGYSHRRTVGWVKGLSTEENEDLLRPGVGGTGECRAWEIGLAPPST
ncbi:unnamed protein product [Tilletia controversa]|uniref:25S rRNA (uridine-N(3))-methyltransferase BMT5-like domain-containing protein n=3 Tax=Tilletia TaxID=13289 RepID=A0A8X7MUD0_9BASI|nr:hypothetical protein CF336_g1474 [Tilletia laevis]KAE8204014.1 hypothetical protein CF328_g1330 [Tilletia controversa]CAD6939624.1 unnamed protein product [Tilletia caries]KAE8202571.1 hypothetical protein CF335_g3367 [Tilletia laevis]KAE8247908.1 hypothetical protein A4X06_0g4098 [Tilletia controversa]